MGHKTVDGTASTGGGVTAMQPAVFLDRDNTIIHNDGDLGDPTEVRLIQGAASAIASLRGLGYKVVVVTNQGGVARGKYTEKDVEAVHERINELVQANSRAGIERFYYCPYHPDAKVERYRKEHPWRKPNPGMIVQAAEDLSIDLAQSWMVGDQMRDIEAGRAAGVRTVLLRDDAEELTPLKIEQLVNAEVHHAADSQRIGPHFTARSLVEAVRIIAQQRKPEAGERMRRNIEDEARRKARDVTDRFRPDSAEAVGSPTPRLTSASTRPRAAISGPAPDRAPTPDVPRVATPPAPPKPVTPSAEPPVPPPPDQPSPPTSSATPTSEASSDTPKPEAASETATSAATLSQSPSTPPTSAPPTITPSDTTLRQILQELRNQRTQTDDFSYMRVVAIVLQLIAAVSLLGALWLGSDDLGSFTRWIGAALCLQLAVIAALLFDR